MILSLLLACTPTPESSPSTLVEKSSSTTKATEQAQPAAPSRKDAVHNQDQGQQHPPLPADNPVWSWDAKGFVPDYGWFGEHSWMDVRMRVAGHLSAAGRDWARVAAQKGDFKEAEARYTEIHELLSTIPSPTQGFSAEINTLLIQALERNASWMRLLAASEPSSKPLPPIKSKPSLSDLRARYYQLALLFDHDRENPELPALCQELQKALLPFLQPRADLGLEDFDNFIDRHKLRVRLYEAYLDALDPIAPHERWGYWEATEITRQALLLGWATGIIGGESWAPRISEHSSGEWNVPVLAASAVLWPSELAQELKSPDQNISFEAEELGLLPTGDSLIDVAAHPGPKAIGTLEKLGLDDPEHRSWLTQLGQELDTALTTSSAETSKQCKEAIDTLDAYTHGSRFYNVKQLRNGCVRQLARGGYFLDAEKLLQENFPLHHQDWACPNREGILLAISGRLLLLGGADNAEAQLRKALSAGQQFLKQVDLAEQGAIDGPRPPSMGHATPKDHRGQKNHNLQRPPHQKGGNHSPSQR